MEIPAPGHEPELPIFSFTGRRLYFYDCYVKIYFTLCSDFISNPPGLSL